MNEFITPIQVSGKTDATRKFLEVRNNTRRNAVVYKDKILPLTEDVIRHIKFFVDTFLDFDYDEWTEGLEDILDDIDKGIALCQILR